jgi:hypothetical protein
MDFSPCDGRLDGLKSVPRASRSRGVLSGRKVFLFFVVGLYSVEFAASGVMQVVGWLGFRGRRARNVSWNKASGVGQYSFGGGTLFGRGLRVGAQGHRGRGALGAARDRSGSRPSALDDCWLSTLDPRRLWLFPNASV